MSINPNSVPCLLALWHGQLTGEALVTGESLNLDFHSVRVRPEDNVKLTIKIYRWAMSIRGECHAANDFGTEIVRAKEQ
jgi:hypothetical protein